MTVDIDTFLEQHGELPLYTASESTQVSRGQAMRLACRLAKNPDILGVELFGSLTRQYYGNDMDLILTVSEERSMKFIALLTSWAALSGGVAYDVYRAESIIDVRQRLAVSAMPSLVHSLRLARDIVSPNSIDLFLFPADWKKRLAEIQGKMRTWDPQFMNNIAATAIRLPSRTR